MTAHIELGIGDNQPRIEQNLGKNATLSISTDRLQLLQTPGIYVISNIDDSMTTVQEISIAPESVSLIPTTGPHILTKDGESIDLPITKAGGEEVVFTYLAKVTNRVRK